MKQYILDNKQAYEKTAQEFQAKKAVRLAADTRIVNDFKRHVPKGATVLELGVGSGQVSRLLTKSGLTVEAIEYAPEMAKLAAQTAPQATIIVDEFLSHDFAAQQYDGIIGIAFVHLFTQEDAALVMAKIYDLLKPGGIVLLATTVHEKTYDDVVKKTNFQVEVTRFRRHYSIADFKALFTQASLKIVDTTFNTDKEVKAKQWMDVFGVKS